jgi:hypothetical protein
VRAAKTYQGTACRRGHDGTRYLSGTCVECERERMRERHARPEYKEKKGIRARERKIGLVPEMEEHRADVDGEAALLPWEMR